MKDNYKDIASRITDPIRWYDDNGCPRYDKHHPTLCPNIYADEVVLLQIRCQDSRCHKRFLVQQHAYISFGNSIAKALEMYMKDPVGKRKWFPLHYGDPPNHGCIGDTMNCEDISIKEFWYKDRGKRKKDKGWIRRKMYEIKNAEEYD